MNMSGHAAIEAKIGVKLCHDCDHRTGRAGGVVSKCVVERDDHSMCTGLNRTGIRWNVDRGNGV